MTSKTAKDTTKPQMPKLLAKAAAVPENKVPDTTKGKKAPAKKAAETKTEKAKKAPAKKAAEKQPEHLRTRNGIEEQKCAGACGKWLPIDQFARKSKARGGGPIRRCKSCITAEQKARKAAKGSPSE